MKKTEVKKVSFRVRRIYYDQFLAGTKHEELRALTLYWYRILRPHVSKEYYFHPLIMEYEKKTREYGKRPTIAVVHTPKQPTLYFQIRYIEVVSSHTVCNLTLLNHSDTV